MKELKRMLPLQALHVNLQCGMRITEHCIYRATKQFKIIDLAPKDDKS